MAEPGPATAEQTDVLEELVDAGLVIRTGSPGVLGRSASFEGIRLALEWALERTAAPDRAEEVRFPPVLPRRHVEAAGYQRLFPHLLGSVFAFEGDDGQALERDVPTEGGGDGDWSEVQGMTDLVLVPAACYPVYPAVAERGPVPPGGVTINAGGAWVFRREPSSDPARLQAFHQWEIVRIGEPESVASWRHTWRDRAVSLLERLGLEPDVAVASDAFFGHGGRMLAASQVEQELKLEVGVPVAAREPTAVASLNYHVDHFGSAFGLRLASGGVAHTACVGFGEERIVLALLRAHGPDTDVWPESVRATLGDRV